MFKQFDTLDSKAQVFGTSFNFRPSLTRAETIESCNSDDLVTVLEAVHEKRKPYKLLDRSREVKKGVMAETLQELIERGIVKSLVTEHILIFRQPRAFLKAFL